MGKCKSVLWNGPVGIFEIKPFARGTMSIAHIVAELTGKVIKGHWLIIIPLHFIWSHRFIVKKKKKMGEKGVTTIIGGGDSVAAVHASGVADKVFNNNKILFFFFL